MTMTLTDGMTEKEIIDFVRETLGVGVATAAQRALDGADPVEPETFVIGIKDNETWFSYTVRATDKMNFDDFCTAVVADGDEYSRIVEVKVVRQAAVTRTVDTRVEEVSVA